MLLCASPNSVDVVVHCLLCVRTVYIYMKVFVHCTVLVDFPVLLQALLWHPGNFHAVHVSQEIF